jgi:predicted dithiol-disulfide oxidoreductase (DUF899 family)
MIGTREEWLSDELARQRQALPWVPVEREYEFEAPEGTPGLGDWPRRHDEYEEAVHAG